MPGTLDVAVERLEDVVAIRNIGGDERVDQHHGVGCLPLDAADVLGPVVPRLPLGVRRRPAPEPFVDPLDEHASTVAALGYRPRVESTPPSVPFDELHARLEADREAAAKRAVAEERQRIARELHDVVAHSVSVMTVQAGAVRRLLHPDQERERLALETIEATGREALTEMRRLVGLLREQGATPEFVPPPTMRAVDILVGTVRESGLSVELDVEGEPQELPPGVDLAAYRVIQESLTNALKYAGPAHAWVTVRWADDGLELEIANDGKSEARGRGGGHGLAGLRERVSLVGGAIEAGPRDGGGFVVNASLPLGGQTR